MRDMARFRGRLAIVAAVTAVAALGWLPQAAYAHTATKLTVTSPVTVDNSVMGTTPVAPTITAKLYRKSHGRYLALSGCVRCYFVDSKTGLWQPSPQTKTGSKVTFTLASRGQYVVTYSGTRTYKGARAYTGRRDRVGATAATPTVSVTEVDGTFSRVDVSYGVSWNTDAYTGPVMFMYAGVFTTDPQGLQTDMAGASGTTALIRYIDEPEVISFSYYVRTARAIGSLLAAAMVSPTGDPYVAADPIDPNPFVYPR
jgi:hypothetical protein